MVLKLAKTISLSETHGPHHGEKRDILELQQAKTDQAEFVESFSTQSDHHQTDKKIYFS
jgi:hypothetical protein